VAVVRDLKSFIILQKGSCSLPQFSVSVSVPSCS